MFLHEMLDTYDDYFFGQLDGVANALDNIDASKSILYLPNRTMIMQKPC